LFIKFFVFKDDKFLQDTADIRTVAGKGNRGPTRRGQKLVLVWKNRKRISQIIKDYLYLLFSVLFI
jgi:hypothetical protein